MERLFGTNPDSASSSNPHTVNLDAAGNLSYTRRDATLTGYTYKVWVSTSLEAGSWIEDTAASQTPGIFDANDIETVAVTIFFVYFINDELFVCVSVE